MPQEAPVEAPAELRPGPVHDPDADAPSCAAWRLDADAFRYPVTGTRIATLWSESFRALRDAVA